VASHRGRQRFDGHIALGQRGISWPTPHRREQSGRTGRRRWNLGALDRRGDAKMMQNRGVVRKPLVELERAKGFDQEEPVKCQRINLVVSNCGVATYIAYLGVDGT
jgi:hypothetical protein